MKNTDFNFPLKIQFRDIDESDFVYNAIWDHVEKLEKYSDRIQDLQVVLSAPHRHHHGGIVYHVQIRASVPGDKLVVSTEREKDGAHEDAYVALRDAFAAMKRQLDGYAERKRKRPAG